MKNIPEKTLTHQSKKTLNLKTSRHKSYKIQDIMKRPNLIGMGDGDDSQLKAQKYFFNKIIEEKFPSLRRECLKTYKKLIEH